MPHSLSDPLKNRAVLFRLNPYAKSAIRMALSAEAAAKAGKAAPGRKQPLVKAGKVFKDTLLSA